VPLTPSGQGSVFSATLSAPSGGVDTVALKIYNVGTLEERTDREIAAMRRLSSPCLVRLIGSGTQIVRGSDCIWIETEFIEGRSIATELQDGPLSELRTAAIIRDVAIAIEALWDERIVHRDIKPANVMLTGSGRAVVIDLGLARHVDLSSVTGIGATCGTLGYLSPEQARANHALTCKSDIFALGILAEECLLGRHPTGNQQSYLLTGGPKVATLGLRPSPILETVVDSMIQTDAFRRPNPAQVVSEMRKLIGGATP